MRTYCAILWYDLVLQESRSRTSSALTDISTQHTDVLDLKSQLICFFRLGQYLWLILKGCKSLFNKHINNSLLNRFLQFPDPDLSSWNFLVKKGLKFCLKVTKSLN